MNVKLEFNVLQTAKHMNDGKDRKKVVGRKRSIKKCKERSRKRTKKKSLKIKRRSNKEKTKRKKQIVDPFGVLFALRESMRCARRWVIDVTVATVATAVALFSLAIVPSDRDVTWIYMYISWNNCLRCITNVCRARIAQSRIRMTRFISSEKNPSSISDCWCSDVRFYFYCCLRC